MNTQHSRSREEILADIASLEVLAKGKITPKTTRGGKPNGYKLQRWRDGKNHSIHVPPEKADLIKQATENHGRFHELVDEYVEVCEENLLNESDLQKKKRQPKRPSRR